MLVKKLYTIISTVCLSVAKNIVQTKKMSASTKNKKKVKSDIQIEKYKNYTNITKDVGNDLF